MNQHMLTNCHPKVSVLLTPGARQTEVPIAGEWTECNFNWNFYKLHHRNTCTSRILRIFIICASLFSRPLRLFVYSIVHAGTFRYYMPGYLSHRCVSRPPNMIIDKSIRTAESIMTESARQVAGKNDIYFCSSSIWRIGINRLKWLPAD